MVDVVPYPKLRALKYIEHVLTPTTEVVIQEKIDGSNVGIRMVDGQLVLQSRTTIIDQTKPGMFSTFVGWARSQPKLRVLPPGCVLFGEFSNNQQKIKYAETCPFILFDVLLSEGLYASVDYLQQTSAYYGLPTVPLLYSGPWGQVTAPLDQIVAEMTDKQEGIVVKAYNVSERWEDTETGTRGMNQHALVGGKIVRPEFQETKVQPTTLPVKSDLALDRIADMLVTPARVLKAVRGVAEAGGDYTKAHLAIPRVGKDAHDEDVEAIKNLLFKAYWGQINRRIATRTLDLHAGAIAALQPGDA